MTRRRLAAFVEALLGNRRPQPFAAESDEVDAMRAAIELRAAQPGASLPRGEFVAELHHRLAEELDRSAPAEADAGGGRLSRRGVLTGSAAAAEADDFHRGKMKSRLAFELPRGCYATLLVKRITAGAGSE